MRRERIAASFSGLDRHYHYFRGCPGCGSGKISGILENPDHGVRDIHAGQHPRTHALAGVGDCGVSGFLRSQGRSLYHSPWRKLPCGWPAEKLYR
jgi:hypothetical protein